jgi:gluconolactonase
VRSVTPKLEILVDGLDHPEGVAYDPQSGSLWAGGEDGQLYRVDLARRSAVEVARVPGFVHGLAVDGLGRIVLCCGPQGSIWAWDESDVQLVAEGLGFPNFPAFGADGALYVSDSGRWGRGDGRVLRLGTDGDVDVLSTALPHFPNGCAVSRDGRWLWIVDSYEPTVNRIDLASGEVEHVLGIDGVVPDGLALTEGDGLLVSCYRPDRIYHLDADGTLEIAAEDPQGTLLAAPTNVCFVGAELDRVVAANLGRWHLTSLDLGLLGAPLHRPDRWAVDAA